MTVPPSLPLLPFFMISSSSFPPFFIFITWPFFRRFTVSSGYSNILQLTFSSQALSIREAETKRINTDAAILWLSLLHGNTPCSIFSDVIPYPDFDPYDDDDDYFWVSMTLVMDTLDCNPPITMCLI